MKKKKILWISRHPLWVLQKELLKNMHGKRCSLEERNLRFQDRLHFADFISQYIDTHYIYVVVPKPWLQYVQDLGYSIGIMRRPVITIKKGKKRKTFSAEYFFDSGQVISKIISQYPEEKGYRNSTKSISRRAA